MVLTNKEKMELSEAAAIEHYIEHRVGEDGYQYLGVDILEGSGSDLKLKDVKYTSEFGGSVDTVSLTLADMGGAVSGPKRIKWRYPFIVGCPIDSLLFMCYENETKLIKGIEADFPHLFALVNSALAKHNRETVIADDGQFWWDFESNGILFYQTKYSRGCRIPISLLKVINTKIF